jgi:tetratricopeptide (TPR) repeat protein
LSALGPPWTRRLGGTAAAGLLLLPCPAAASEPPLVVPVTVAVDETFRADPLWTHSVARAFARASDRVGTPLGIRFKVERRAAWAPAGASLDDYLGRLRAQIGARPGGIVVGLTSQRPEPRHVFGATDYVDALTVLSVPSAGDAWDRNLAHELGHVLGAIDVEGDDELMAGEGRGLRIDAMNARLMRAHHQRRFPPARFPLEGADLDAAARLYQEAALFAPEGAYPALIRVERARGDLQAALRAAVRLAAARPDGRSLDLRAQVLADLGRLEGSARAQSGRREEAIDTYRRAVMLEPDNAPALAELARLLLEAGQPEEAIDHARRAVRAQPGLQAAQVNLAAAYLKLGRDREAEEAAREELRRRPRSPQGLTNLALVRQLRGDLRGALDLLERAAELAPDDADVLANLGTLEAQAGRRPQALRAYLRLLELRPNDGTCHNDVAVLYFREGQVDAARRHVSRALALGAPVSHDFLAALARAPADDARASAR